MKKLLIEYKVTFANDEIVFAGWFDNMPQFEIFVKERSSFCNKPLGYKILSSKEIEVKKCNSGLYEPVGNNS